MRTTIEPPKPPTVGLGLRLFCFATLSALGLAVQSVPIELFLGVEIILGGFAPLLLALVFGPVWGAASVVIVFAATWYRWGHPYALILALIEVVWVGILSRQSMEKTLRSDVIFWIVVGCPLGYLFYTAILDIQPSTSVLVMLIQATNGALNTVIALISVLMLPARFRPIPVRLPTPRQLPLGLVLDMTLTGFCLVPAMILLVVGGKSDLESLKQSAVDELRIAAQGADHRIDEWLSYSKSAVETLARLGTDFTTTSGAQKQQHVTAVAKSNPDFHNMSLVNADGITVAFEPPVNDRNESTIGLDFSNRDYFRRVKTEKTTVISDVFTGRGGVFVPIITISTPIPVESGFVGFALGAIKLSSLSRILRGVPDDHGPEVNLLDTGSRIIASTNNQLQPMSVLELVSDDHRRILQDNTFIQLPYKADNTTIENWALAHVVHVNALNEIPGWNIVARIPMTRYQQPLIRGYTVRFSLVFIALALALLVSALLQRIFARPLTRLAAVTQNFPESGQMPNDHDWPRSSIEEIDRLTTNFVAMTHVLSEYVSTLKIRTDELATANDELRTEMNERRRLERHVHQAQKMQAIGTLAGGIAHDFNNMLAAIMGYANLVQLDLPDSHPSQLKLQELLKASHRARDLVKQILMFSRRSEQEQRPVDLARIVQDALALVRPSLPTTVRIETDLPLGPLAIVGDPTQINQLIVNLCANAEHAMRPGGGMLTVRLRSVHLADRLTIAQPIVGPGEYYQLTLADGGHGMSKETLERIFEPFFTTKGVGEGTGLGLSLVHGVASSHKGGIVVYSSVDVGTTFEVYFPAVDADVLTPLTPVHEIPKGNERLYFVDDEPAIADVGAEMLRTLGYDVVSFTSAEAALEAFRLEADRVDLVLTDQTMPGMTGDTLVRRLREVRPGLATIICSGFSHVMTPEKARSLGIDDFIFKPFDLKLLARAVRTALDRRHKAK